MKTNEHEDRPISNSENLVFDDKFSEVSIEEILSQLADNRFYFFDGAVSSNYVDKILQESTASSIGLNHNDVAPVRYFRQTFFSNCLASSKSIVELITNRIVHDIVRSNLGSKYRLKCQRYYESAKGYQLG